MFTHSTSTAGDDITPDSNTTGDDMTFDDNITGDDVTSDHNTTECIAGQTNDKNSSPGSTTECSTRPL